MCKLSLIFAALVAIHECGILSSRYPVADRPQCIWVWHPKYPRYPANVPLSTTVPVQTTTVTAVEEIEAEADNTRAVEEVTAAEAVTTEANDASAESE